MRILSVLVALAFVLPTSARAGDAFEGMGVIYLYSQRCVPFESLPLKTQEALRLVLSIDRNAVMNSAIYYEADLKTLGKDRLCSMIRESFPTVVNP